MGLTKSLSRAKKDDDAPKKKSVVSVKAKNRSSRDGTPQKVPKRKRIRVIVSSSKSSPDNVDSTCQGDQVGRTSSTTISIESSKESNVDSNNNTAPSEREVTVSNQSNEVQVTVQTAGSPEVATNQTENQDEMEQLQIDLQLSDTDSTFSIRTPSPPVPAMPAPLSMEVLVEESSPPCPSIRSVVKIPDKKRDLDTTGRSPTHRQHSPGRSPLNRQHTPHTSSSLDPTRGDPQRRHQSVHHGHLDTTSRRPFEPKPGTSRSHSTPNRPKPYIPETITTKHGTIGWRHLSPSV